MRKYRKELFAFSVLVKSVGVTKKDIKKSQGEIGRSREGGIRVGNTTQSEDQG